VSSASEIFTGRAEGQKAKNMGFALPPAGLVRAFARRTIQPSDLLTFL
jgi:hypothetical protein